MAPVSAATAMTRLGGTNRNSGSRSMKRVTSQGQAMRSIFGRSRVTHFMVQPPFVDDSALIRIRSHLPERLGHLEFSVASSHADVLQQSVVEQLEMPALAASFHPLAQQSEQTAERRSESMGNDRRHRARGCGLLARPTVKRVIDNETSPQDLL